VLGKEAEGKRSKEWGDVCQLGKLRLELTAPAVLGSSVYIFALHPKSFFLFSRVVTLCPSAEGFTPSFSFFFLLNSIESSFAVFGKDDSFHGLLVFGDSNGLMLPIGPRRDLLQFLKR
jgi:hypothetical protein